MANYLSIFNEHATQVDWNEASLIAPFQEGLNDKILDSIVTKKSNSKASIMDGNDIPN